MAKLGRLRKAGTDLAHAATYWQRYLKVATGKPDASLATVRGMVNGQPIPDTIRSVQEDLVPLIHGLRQAQARMGTVTGLLRRRGRDDVPEPPTEPPTEGA